MGTDTSLSMKYKVQDNCIEGYEGNVLVSLLYITEKVSKSKFYRLVRENKFPKPISRGYFENQDGWIFFVQTNNKKHKSYWSQYNLYWHLMRSTKNESNNQFY